MLCVLHIIFSKHIKGKLSKAQGKIHKFSIIAKDFTQLYANGKNKHTDKLIRDLDKLNQCN